MVRKRKLDEATVVLSAESKQLLAGLNTAQRQIAGFAKKAGGLLLGIAGARTVGSAFSGFLQQADDLQNAANKIGLTTDALQELRFAGQEVGVATNTTDMALQRFTRRVGEAAQGTGELKDTLKQYGIAVRDSEGNTRGVVDVLGDLADVIAGAESDQERLRIAFKSFDSEGAALVNMLRDGSHGLDQFKQRARDLGLVIKRDTVAEMAQLNREFEKFTDRLSKGAMVLGGMIAGAFHDAELAITGDTESIQALNRAWQEQLKIVEDLETRRTRVSNQALGPEQNERMRSRVLERLTEQIKEAEAEAKSLEATINTIKILKAPEIDGESLNTHSPFELKQQDAFAQMIKDIESQTQSAISRVLELQGVSQSTIKISLMSLQIENRLKEQGIELSKDQRAELNLALDTLESKIDKTQELQEATRSAQRASEAWTNALNQGLADAIFRAKDFGDILDALGKRLLNNALFGLDGAGGLLGGITSSIGGKIGGFFSGLGFASGGVTPVNSPFLVGERGPELMSFNRPMRVHNAHNTRQMMSGSAPVINQTNHFDLVPAPTIQAMIDNAIPRVANEAATLAVRLMQRGF